MDKCHPWMKTADDGHGRQQSINLFLLLLKNATLKYDLCEKWYDNKQILVEIKTWKLMLFYLLLILLQLMLLSTGLKASVTIQKSVDIFRIYYYFGESNQKDLLFEFSKFIQLCLSDGQIVEVAFHYNYKTLIFINFDNSDPKS